MLLAAGRLSDYWRLALLTANSNPDLISAALGHLDRAFKSSATSEKDKAIIALDLGAYLFSRKEYYRAHEYLVQARDLSSTSSQR